jgi:DNA-binding transcriptional LysR family regulator
MPAVQRPVAMIVAFATPGCLAGEDLMDRVAAMTTFVKVVEAGSLSAAARTLDLSLASVSRQVDGLEEHLRTRLLVRTTRHMALTEGGRTYYDQAKRILAAIEEAEVTLSAQHAMPSGRLIISAPVLFGRVYVAPLLPEFMARYPEVAIDLLLLDRPVSLVEEGIDVAVRAGPLEDSNLIARKLGTVKRVLCAAPAYLQHCDEPRVPQDLQDHECIIHTALDETQAWHFHTENGELRVPVRGRLRTNNIDTTVLAALGGAGLVLAPSWLVEDHLRSGRLIELLQPFESPPTDIHALFPHLHLMSAKTRAFTDFLVDRLVTKDFQFTPPA